MNVKRISFCLATAALLAGCDTTPVTESPLPATPEELGFYADVSGPLLSRVTGTSWDDDEIGIFMTDADRTETLAANKRYSTPSTGLFTAAAAGEGIETPETGETVDLFAYYPYSAGVTDTTLPVDISDQTNQSALDLLWSSNLDNLSDFSSEPVFHFLRRMVKIELDVTAGTKVSSLAGLTAQVSGIPAKGSFDLKTGTLTPNPATVTPFDAAVTASGTTTKVEMTIMPPAAANPKITFSLPDGSAFEWTVPGDLVAGNRYTFELTLSDSNGSVAPNPAYKYVELPAMPSISGVTYYSTNLPAPRADKRNYSMAWSADHKIAYWVAYPLHSSYLKSGNRTDRWAFDPNIPQNLQPNLNSGFPSAGHSGYDRGHQLPSADRNYSTTENETTFYYTNMTPQNATLNQGQWEQLESRVRVWVNQCDTLYVVTGAMPAEGTYTDNSGVTYFNTHNNNKMVCPKYYFKALAKRVGDTYHTVAFKMPNAIPNGGYNSYRLTVSELEAATGFTFFPSIPAAAKNSITTNQWQ